MQRYPMELFTGERAVFAASQIQPVAWYHLHPGKKKKKELSPERHYTKPL